MDPDEMKQIVRRKLISIGLSRVKKNEMTDRIFSSLDEIFDPSDASIFTVIIKSRFRSRRGIHVMVTYRLFDASGTKSYRGWVCLPVSRLTPELALVQGILDS